MLPFKVILVPAKGHSDDDGAYDRGVAIAPIAEIDIVDLYMPSIIEELEMSNIRHSVLNTRKHPGIKESERHNFIDGGSIVVELGIGWQKKLRTRNGSQVFYGSKESLTLANDISDALVDWGKCSTFHHVRLNPTVMEKPLLNVPETLGIRIEPFSLNGPFYDDYARRLKQLGKEIGCYLAEFCRSKNPNMILKPSKAPERITRPAVVS